MDAWKSVKAHSSFIPPKVGHVTKLPNSGLPRSTVCLSYFLKLIWSCLWSFEATNLEGFGSLGFQVKWNSSPHLSPKSGYLFSGLKGCSNQLHKDNSNFLETEQVKLVLIIKSSMRRGILYTRSQILESIFKFLDLFQGCSRMNKLRFHMKWLAQVKWQMTG